MSNVRSSPELPGLTTDDGRVYARVSAPDRHLGLAVLLNGQTGGDAVAVQDFLAFASDHRFSLDELWAAYRDGVPEAAVLIVPNAGRTGMVFLSPLAAGDQHGVLVRLIQIACRGQDGHRLRLIQALLDPQQRREREVVGAAGFLDLAELLYLERPSTSQIPALALGDDIECLHWSSQTRPMFVRTILASYEQTRDCPGLVGLRHIDDILAGHMASGIFRPKLWFCLHHGGQPVAVMLLNEVPRQAATELVYLGVSQAWRGKGIGRGLLEHAIGLAGQHGDSSLNLAVDRRNEPAVRLYRSLQFTSTARKLAMLHVIEGPQPAP